MYDPQHSQIDYNQFRMTRIRDKKLNHRPNTVNFKISHSCQPGAFKMRGFFVCTKTCYDEHFFGRE